MFRRLEQRLLQMGSATSTALLAHGLRGNENAIAGAVAGEKWINSRDLLRALGLSQRRNLEVLLDYQLHP